MGEKIEGFDTEPGGLSDFDDLSDAPMQRRFDRRHEPDFEKTLPGPDVDRRLNDAQTNRRLFALKRAVEGAQHSIRAINTTMAEEKLERQTMKLAMDKNNDMTAEMLSMMKNGKGFVAVVKFAGALAVPIAAIATAFHVIFGGGAGPKL